MGETKSYPLRLPIVAKIFIPLVLVSMLVIGTFGMVPQYPDPGVVIFSIVWFGVLLYMITFVFSLPLEIVHRPDDTLEFRSPLRKRRIPIASLIAVEPVPSQFGFFYFRHRHGKIPVLIHFDGFHRLNGTIAEVNPEVQLRGC
jgi:hypothetical protein